ncbi:hypothetical protein BD769DRAFT_1646124 [Suillus cothurnatus]|nr:hypothetical protein BD769DRAFT_1646124 [Suillus cothurnatus]
MKFISLTTVIITAAAMTDMASAAGGPDITCTPGYGWCALDYASYNNGNDFAFGCGSNGHSDSWTPCSCKGCCKVIVTSDGFTKGVCE